MTSIFDGLRADPHTPAPLVPEAATGPDVDGDGGGLDFSFMVSLGANLGRLADGLETDRERRNHRGAPGDEQLFRSGVAPASGALLLDLGSVPLGRVWQVRRLVVGGIAVTTTAAGQAYAFARGAPPTDLALTDCVDIFLTLPQGNTYGTHQLFLLASEHLWVAFNGGTSGQQYAASARVEDWDAAEFRSTFAE